MSTLGPNKTQINTLTSIIRKNMDEVHAGKLSKRFYVDHVLTTDILQILGEGFLKEGRDIFNQVVIQYGQEPEKFK